jgi:ComF family protein
MAMPGWADTWIGGALDAVFAPRCVACRKPTGPHRSGPVCAACWQSVQALSPPWCARCGEPSRTGLTASPGHCARCQAHPPHFDEARALGVYTGALRHIVHALKYRGHQSLGAPLGALLRDRGDDILSAADAVVPVPLHPWRHLQRGFNQADELARTLGPPVWRPLRRRRLGTPQAGLRGQDRLTNVRDAYRLRLAAYGQPPPKYVVLIDDVMTTGATLDACSRVLREAGVVWIGALTVARTVTLMPPPTSGGSPRPPLRAPRLWTPHR